jgi:hypothetical protein
MSQTTSLDWAYAAGLFDGEGSITLAPNSRSGSPALKVCLSVCHKETVLWLQTTFGGLFSESSNGPLATRTIWRWTVNGKAAKPFLVGVLPFLKIKKGEALVVLEFPTDFSKEPQVRLVRELLAAELDSLRERERYSL